MEDQPNQNPGSEPQPSVQPIPSEPSPAPMAAPVPPVTQSPVESAPVNEPMVTPAPVTEAPKTEASAPTGDDDVKKNKIVAAISYIGILWVIPLFFVRKSPFAQFHAKQGLMLFIISIVLAIICELLMQVSSVFVIIKALTSIAVLVLAIIGIIKALEGKLWEMPVIGEWARKINI